MTGFRDHFSTRAAEYAAYRPSYPPELLEYVTGLCARRELAWDAGTGNGQAAVLLAERFARVVATDASAEQIARARPHPRVEYRVAREDDSGLAPASADLVTVAQALHWFDRSRFYAEARRVLRPGGVCAVWTYGMPTIDAAIDAAWRCVHAERIAHWWPPERRHVDAMYQDVEFPFAEIAPPPMSMRAELTREQFLGYVATWSAVTRAREGTGTDPVPVMRDALAPLWRDGPDAARVVTWPIGLRVGRMTADDR